MSQRLPRRRTLPRLRPPRVRKGASPGRPAGRSQSKRRRRRKHGHDRGGPREGAAPASDIARDGGEPNAAVRPPAVVAPPSPIVAEPLAEVDLEPSADDPAAWLEDVEDIKEELQETERGEPVVIAPDGEGADVHAVAEGVAAEVPVEGPPSAAPSAEKGRRRRRRGRRSNEQEAPTAPGVAEAGQPTSAADRGPSQLKSGQRRISRAASAR